MKITNNHKLFYANKKLGMKNDVSIHTLVNFQVTRPDAFLTEKYNACRIIASNYRRQDFDKFVKMLEHWRLHAATRQLMLASSRLLRNMKNKRSVR